MKIILTIFFVLIVSANSYSQPAGKFNLCGYWYSNQYYCGFNNNIFEVFAISDDGVHITATKIIGDSCVTAGNISWEGDYISATFDVYYQVGNVQYPNAFFIPDQATVIDSAHITVAYMNFYKLSCHQADSLKIQSPQYGVSCDCSIKDTTMIIIPPDTAAIMVDTLCMGIPNAFSPNNDGVNDFFFPIINCPIDDYSLKIFNRWGEVIFASVNQISKWDGKFININRDCPTGSYVWMIHYKESGNAIAKHGTVTLIR